MATLQKTQLEEEEIVIESHHKKTGCKGNIETYKGDDGSVKGYFCSCCKDEWLTKTSNKNELTTVECRHVAHHIVPTLCCMQVSDTGHYIQWKNITHHLKPGDHVAWLRPFLGFWHHAIVEKVEVHSITVIEWTWNSIHRNTIVECDLCYNWCYSPMYKVHYPDEVEQQNPAEVVLMRAHARLGNRGYAPLSDNCEHFAIFCKTGLHRCNQLHQLKVTLRAWIIRIVLMFLRVTTIVSFSETVERFFGQDKRWLGAKVLIATEIFYLIIVFCVIYCHDSQREKFRMDGEMGITRACRCASIKKILQSGMLVSFAIIANVFLLESLNNKYGPWSQRKLNGADIGLGIVGGMAGNIIGFFLFAFIPYSCCRNEIP